MTRYIVRTDRPFSGSIESSTYINQDGAELVSFSGYLYNAGGPDLTIDDYMLKRNFSGVSVISGPELTKMIAEYEGSIIGKLKPIDLERWEYALECLPPCKWHSIAGGEIFHVSERITGDIVNWYFKSNSCECFELSHYSTATDHQLFEILQGRSE